MCCFTAINLGDFKFRGIFNSIRGGIRPTVAHCLVRASIPQSNEIFYDPFCGSGTIVLERSFYPYKKLFASDISEEAINTAKSNLDKGVVLLKADAVNTKMKTGYVDTVVTNLPWGKQIPMNDDLYYNFLKELKRILKANGKAVILTDQTELLTDSCLKNGFECSVKAELSLHGLHPKIFELKKS